MFSGIIETMVPILSVSEADGTRRVRVKAPRGWKFKIGASVSVDGICSTITKTEPGFFEVEYMPETLLKTTAQSFVKSRAVNLERSMRLGDSIDGHFVAGHVDAKVAVANVEKRGKEINISISLPRPLLRFVAPQGSITINGVALTTARLKGSLVTVALIPHTIAHTNLDGVKGGDHVNIEVDLLARYVATLLKK